APLTVVVVHDDACVVVPDQEDDVAT
ncbi:hypothetical protein A2U01_0102283, partial [Trifolium medium]|nr:hypothetical protein [Trifolium medium]